MMQTLLSLSRLLPAAAFVIYAVAINLSVMDRAWFRAAADGRGWLNGEVAATFGGLYEHALPHRPLARGWLGAARYLLVREGRAGVVIGQEGWLFTAEETRIATPAQIARAAGHVAQIAQRLNAMGADLVLVPIPAKLDIARQTAPDLHLGQAMADQYAAFAGALAARGVAVADIRPSLIAAQGADAQGDGAEVFLRTDTHWTPHGAALAAEAVAASGLIALGDTRFRRVAAATMVFPGDLVSFVTTGAIAPRLGLAPERVVPWVAEPAEPTGAGIFAADAPDPDIVLIGTSYSATPSWSFGPALSRALGRPILNLAEPGLGPIRTMAGFVATDRLAPPRPMTVIWEFPIRYLADPEIWPDAPAASAPAHAGAPVDG